MSWHSRLDSVFGAGASSRGVPIVATAFAGIALTLLSSSLNVARSPKLLKAPEPKNEGAYPPDLFEEGRHDLTTPYGNIRYYEVGPKDGKKILLVHGISTPSPAWKFIVPALTQAGYRVLCYDLPGRGYSDTPQVAQDTALFVSHLALLLSALPHWDKFTIVGMSMGGPIASAFASFYPDRVHAVVLLCPAGATPRRDLKLSSYLIRSSWFPHSLAKLFILGNFAPLPVPKSIDTLPGWQLKFHPGFAFALTSSIQSAPLYDGTAFLQNVVDTFGSKVEAVVSDTFYS